jgi:hypothetical protein
MPVTPLKPVGVGAAPSWVNSSLQWLRENYPHYATSTADTPEKRLVRSLFKMGFALALMEQLAGGEEGSVSSKDHETHLNVMVGSLWGEQLHNEMRRFLDGGGLAADRVMKGVIPMSSASKVTGKQADMVVADDVTALKDLKPPAQMSPEHEIEAFLEQEMLEDDPRAGSF